MIDYVGRTQSLAEGGIPWNQWIGGLEENRQREWANQYLRDTADRQNRAAREINAGNLQDWGANAGLFDNRNSVARNLHRQDNPTIAPRAEMFPEPPADAGFSTTVGPNGETLTPPAAPTQGGIQAPRRSYDIVHPRTLTREQRTAYRDYLRVTRTNPEAQRQSPNLSANSRPLPGVTPQQEQAARARLNAAGLDIVNGHLVTFGGALDRRDTGNPAELVGLDALPNAPEEPGTATDEQAPQQTPGQMVGMNLGQLGGNTEADPSTDQYYQGTNDTSRPLAPTPEMRATDLIIQTSFRQAQTYARYGMTAESQQAMTQAVQGQASYWQQENNQLLRAFGIGNIQAGGALIARFNGYEPSDVRIRQTQESRPRNVLEFRDEQDPNTWRAAFELPQSREQLYYQLEQLADATSARARAEITQHNIENLRQQQVQLTIASWEAQNRFLQTMSEAQQAQMRMATDRAIAAGGRPQIAQDGNGSLFLVYPEINPATGQVTQTVEVLRVGEHRTANVDGENQTVDGPYRTRLTN